MPRDTESDHEQAERSPPAGREDPHWVRDALAMPIVHKARAVGAALWLFVRSPRTFGERWFEGTGNIPNPVVAMAAAVSILALLGQETKRILKREAVPHTLITSLAESIAPYVMYVGIGLVAHLVLRLLGSRRKLRTSIGIALLTGAGPGTAVALGVALPTLFVVARFESLDTANAGLSLPTKAAIAIFSLSLYAGFLVLFVRALAGAHGMSAWSALAAVTLGVLAMGFVCGSIEHGADLQQLTEPLGPHPSFYVNRTGGIHYGFIM